MSRRRWIADEVSGDRAALVGAHAEHLARVLRARVGQQFDISTERRVRAGRVVSVEDNRVEFILGEEVPERATTQVSLLLSIFKFDRMEWAVEKCTELGAARIVPLIASRTDVHLAKAATKRVERWRRIARQASEQSRRAAPPEIALPIQLNRANLGATVDPVRIVLAESEQQVMLPDILHSAEGKQDSGITRADPSAAANISSLALAVGPEGGWTADELKLFADCGWRAASLGSRILRAETAAIAAMAIIMAEA